MKVEIDLVDIGGGNIGSVSRCLERLAVPFRTVGATSLPDGSRPLMVPGVGNFGAVMNSLSQSGLDTALKSLVKKGTPYLGICVGMQILFDSSDESAGVAGLGLLPGRVLRFNHDKVPQIGWNRIEPKQASWNDGYAYFVNSYFARPKDSELTLYESNYGGPFCAAVAADKITAFQFHPEKSGPFGEELLKRWLASVN